MGLVIGIDVGGSTTKIVGLNDGIVQSPLFITAADPITSLFGAFGKYIYDNNIALSDIEQVMITGVGSSSVTTPIYGLPTTKVDEFQADGLGARFDSGLDKLIVVSMGTGTTLVKVDGDAISHIGGISMGGGTLQGLASLLLGTSNIGEVVGMATQGNIANVNLSIGDISKNDLEGLPMHATASLFGKVKNNHVTENDIAKGLICMVLETIGSAAVLSQSAGGFKDFVLIGNMTRLPDCRVIFPIIEDLYGVRFLIPSHAEYCTALGAALAYGKAR
ncbi:MAG: type II pantothenate kinase [Muribaculaceae bacterium]|nr:type II pantothenate kinase [Muribaculaceae bacterium]